MELATYKGIISTLLAGRLIGNDIFENTVANGTRFGLFMKRSFHCCIFALSCSLGPHLQLWKMRDSTAPSFIHSKLRNNLSVESVERLTLCKIYLADALKDQEISLANELAIIEAIDDGNDVYHYGWEACTLKPSVHWYINIKEAI